jgi:hypothetical protein
MENPHNKTFFFALNDNLHLDLIKSLMQQCVTHITFWTKAPYLERGSSNTTKQIALLLLIHMLITFILGYLLKRKDLLSEKAIAKLSKVDHN